MMSAKTFLVAQVIRSLREHSEDWLFDDKWAINKHLKLQCYKKGGATLVDVWHKDNVIIRDWRNPCAYFVPWRCRLVHALRNAERDTDVKKVSLKIEDTFETITRDPVLMNQFIADVYGVVGNINNILGGRRVRE